MAYRRRAFDLIGPFDPALDVGTITNGGGDLEMFFRVLKEGYTLVYEPGAIVKHRHRRTYQELRRQISYNGVALYAFFVRSVQAYPEERWPFIRLGIWWFWWWFVRRLILSFLRPDLLPRDLIWAEMGSVATGLRCYKKSRQHAMQISETFSDQPTLLPAEKPPVSSKDKRKYKTAIRTVDISKPLLAITDVSEYAAARVFVTRNEQLLGHIDIPNNFKSIPTLHLIETIVDGMTWKLLGSEGQQNADRIWNDINNSLNRWLLTEDLPRDQIIKQPLAADISVSVIVGTYDRPDDLYKCLESIHRQQTDRPVEVVVVDNNPGSGKTAPVVAQFPDVTLVNEPRKGVSYARNAAINASHGDIIVTTDDDVTMPVDWLEKLLAPLACQHVMAVTGNILPVELETDAQHLFESYGGLGRGYEPKEANFEWFEKFRIHAVPTWEYGGTANAAFRSFLFKTIRDWVDGRKPWSRYAIGRRRRYVSVL